MLKGLDPLLSPELLHLLARLGHGDDIAIVDLNHPAETVASATTSGVLVRLPGLAVERAVEAILTLLPIDDFSEDPVRVMAVVGEPDATPPAMRDILGQLGRSGYRGKVERLERQAFYTAARGAFGVVQCGDPRFYGNVLIRKGAIDGMRPR
ncbi:MAG: fucose-binding protein [Beijerinckiaceae bacterium]|jgi:L-fucose mutarotase|nr:fucose-binding protein [Beijerinckiaceae bacterium]